MGEKMNKKLFLGLSTFFVTAGMAVSAQGIVITAMDDADGLATAIGGTGITITNATYTGVTTASGYFTGGVASGIGMESGIVLTSGAVANINGTTNTFGDITAANSLAGNAYLNALVPGYTTYDATTLEFDFEVTDGLGGDAYFNFVFGSDEYNEWVNSSYNDVFGFFLDGTDVADNVALIPGTNTNVAIDNVNNGVNSIYYNDNDSNGAFAFEYDGFTDVFTVSMEGLDAGNHHFILSIADSGDYAYDSGVFIQGSSFGNVDPSAPIPEPATMLLFGTGLVGLVGSRLRKKKK